MMAADNIELKTMKSKTTEIPGKKPKRSKRNLQSTNSNGITENGNGSITESTSTKTSKQSKNKKSDTTTTLDLNSNDDSNQISPTLTPIESSEKDLTNGQRFEKIELTTVTDEEEDDDDDNRNNKKLGKNKSIQLTTSNLTEPSQMYQSYTSADHEVIEIHEFSIADTDAYLDIYFSTLNNRLTHFIGEDEQLQRFRTAMKNRINSDTNSREYQSVLLGKMNGEVVAAVTLSFPNETTTISNDNILPQSNSCLTSIRRWTIRNANYLPKNMEECYIEMIGVKKAYQKKGIGAAMLECVEHFARQAGANLLTIHVNGEQLRNYFHRSGFDIDHSDSSGFWKWLAERQTTQKMSKPIPPNDDDDDHNYHMDNSSSYINESTLGSEA